MIRIVQYRMVEKIAAMPKRIGKHNLYIIDSTDREALREMARLRISNIRGGTKVSNKDLKGVLEYWNWATPPSSKKTLGVTYNSGKIFPKDSRGLAFIFKDRIKRETDKPISRLVVMGNKKRRFRKVLRNVVEHEKFHATRSGRAVGRSELLAHLVGGLKSTKKFPNLLSIPIEYMAWAGRSRRNMVLGLAPLIGAEIAIIKTMNKKRKEKTLKKVASYRLIEKAAKIVIDVGIGDTLLMGKWKNKKVVIKSIEKDEYGMPVINKKLKAVTFRIFKEKNEKN